MLHSTLLMDVVSLVIAWFLLIILGRLSHDYSYGNEATHLERPKTLPSEAKFTRSKSDRFTSLRKSLFYKRNDTTARSSELALSDDESVAIAHRGLQKFDSRLEHSISGEIVDMLSIYSVSRILK
ncbi:unnamed protein product [Thelazia callipaeda]|uniref:Secreted protein n=1 Tax=Thelazia callipaeda TaxID=103827 RepID=A0A0N5D384_THECL|nr:unnamed protein product [Thelazia callipaeda]